MNLKQRIENLPKVYRFALILIALFAFLWGNSKSDFVTYLFLIVFGAIVIFKWARWIANTAEKAGRSREAFFWFGLLVPVIATFVVILFKPETKPTSTTEK
jgi:hypothetical protein